MQGHHTMKTLVVMNEKGGVGKTNIVAHAGWYFSERLRTLVIDLDQQANLTTTLGANLATVESVELFAEVTQVPSVGALTVTRSTRDLLGVEGADRSCIETFRDSLASMADDYDVCVIDTPPALTNRTFGALLSADAILAPIGINDYSIQGVAELLRAIKGVSAHYERPRAAFSWPSPVDLRPQEQARARAIREPCRAGGKATVPRHGRQARRLREGRKRERTRVEHEGQRSP
ncbi:ParA family protein [Sphingomonas sp. H160509]|uniref:ParA family protein n=1 Tax=Sphingomonas sp. H160509 TaxID=2955313 RepID=UPI0021E81AEE|nr:ParA family protein [Sphingomonas sp. H160509]MDD1453320.1 ParA family protein [Sphingomonas sp. H160509]